MRKTNDVYPVEFTGRWDKKYKLIKVYSNFALYENEKYGYRVCFDLNGIKDEMNLKTAK